MSAPQSTFRQLFALLAIMILMSIVGSLISEGLLMIYGTNTRELVAIESMNLSDRSWFRMTLIINHFAMFLGAALIFGRIYHANTFLHYIKTFKDTTWAIILLWGVVILFSYPFVGWLTQINEMIPLPEWAKSGQDNAFQILANVLNMEYFLEFGVSLILVGILPALGEEFIFRGIIQQKLITSWKNPHAAIIFASLLFGLTHMQLERILPLSFLGLLLGYSYYYSKTIIVPVVLHFFNNSLQVLSLYILGPEQLLSLDEPPSIPIYAAVLSIILTFATLFVAKNRTKELDESRP